MDQNYYKVADRMKVYENGYEDGRRGIIFLPKELNKDFFMRDSSLNLLNENVGWQMFCLDTHSKLFKAFLFILILIKFYLFFQYTDWIDINISTLYCHLLDLKTRGISRSELNRELILYFVISCYMIYAAEVHL